MLPERFGRSGGAPEGPRNTDLAPSLMQSEKIMDQPQDDDDDAIKPEADEESKARAMEEAQKEAAAERANERGYQ